jgi:hypothetical protein
VTGQERIHLGQRHEERVKLSLELRGWHVHPWGQGVLSDEVRQAFNERDNGSDVLLWRWMPDMIAVRGIDIYLIEAKSERRTDTPYFTIEVRSIMAQLAMKTLGLSTVIVWADGTCNRTEDLEVVDFWLPEGKGRRLNNVDGSGTPFARVAKSKQISLDALFGSRMENVA